MSRIDETTDRPTPSRDAAATSEPTRAGSPRTGSAAERLGADAAPAGPDGVPESTGTELGRNGRAETLIPADRARDYRARWEALKGEFVDAPRGAVQGANSLVGEILDELEELFRSQRDGLEQGLADERTSTEDLRLALRRYHSFFDRLLTV